jgi:hypothetical protein
MDRLKMASLMFSVTLYQINSKCHSTKRFVRIDINCVLGDTVGGEDRPSWSVS